MIISVQAQKHAILLRSPALSIVTGVTTAGTTAYCSGLRLFSGIVAGGRVPIGTTVISGVGSDIIVPGVSGLTSDGFCGITWTGNKPPPGGLSIATGPKHTLPVS